MDEELQFLDKERTKELWLFIKTELAKKAGIADLDDYITDTEFANGLANALANYLTKEEVNSALSGATKREVVDLLPSVTDADPKAIYFVPSSGTPEEDNIKDEYMLINGKWEKIGTTRMDLSGYWSKTELKAMTSAELTAILNGT